MHRIDTTRDSSWEYACVKHRHRDIRAVNNHFECRSCGEPVERIVHLPTGERLGREDVEIVGPEASHQAAFDPREV